MDANVPQRGEVLQIIRMLTTAHLHARALGALKHFTSPVFFSTDEAGVTRRGLSGVPQNRPILFVGNHQTYALDVGPMVEALIRERGILPRGLAHPAIWAVSCFECRLAAFIV